GDGLPDPWEVSPSIAGAGFDLIGDGSAEVSRDQVFGANDPPNPLRKDVYTEIDFYDCNLGGCMPGDPMVHELDPTAIANVKSMFAGLPAQNPDKSSGVTLHLQPDEHIIHDPNCLQPPLTGRPSFGTADQRTNSQITDAKALAFRYMISGHSTLRAGGCPTPTLWEIANNMFREDRKSTRLNSSHEWISYAVFCLKKKKKTIRNHKIHDQIQQKSLTNAIKRKRKDVKI